jgi:NTP pyrophosphatase (non-canonical NTP hydrolase)
MTKEKLQLLRDDAKAALAEIAGTSTPVTLALRKTCEDILELVAEVELLSSLPVYMPGDWKCDGCGFTQHNRVLAPNGVFADMKPELRACPNDGRDMRPVTWKEASEENYQAAMRFLNERDEARRHYESLRAAALGLYRKYCVPPAFRNAEERELFERVEGLMASRPVPADPRAESPTWELVLWFAEEMEKKLALNRHKGGPAAWRKDGPFELVWRIEQEKEELIVALAHWIRVGGKEALADVIKEAADVANFAMMIADQAKQAAGTANQQEQTEGTEARP